jgi:hypothetical protein
MKKYLFLPFLMVIMAVSMANAQQIDGRWVGEMQTQEGKVEITFDFKTTGSRLTGTAVTPMGTLRLEEGMVNGSSFSFSLNVETFVVPHRGELIGDRIRLLTDYQGENGEIFLRRLRN